MNEPERVEVAVGVDGSASSLNAVNWAAAEAAKRGGTLRIIHAVPWPALYGPRGPSATRGPVTAEGGRILQEAAAVATEQSPALKIDTDLIPGAPPMVLTVASHEADMLVLGNRGRGGFAGMLMGSLAAALAHRASCPVVIVRGTANPTGPVVVGVDGSPADRLVLAAAFERAQRDAVSVCAIHAWDAPEPFEATPPWSREAQDLQREASRLLRIALAPFEGSHPGVPVERKLVTRSATAALVDASEHGLMVVVGSHGSGALRGLLAGSVCHGVMYHARCPVEIIHVADEIVLSVPAYEHVDLVDHS